MGEKTPSPVYSYISKSRRPAGAQPDSKFVSFITNIQFFGMKEIFSESVHKQHVKSKAEMTQRIVIHRYSITLHLFPEIWV